VGDVVTVSCARDVAALRNGVKEKIEKKLEEPRRRGGKGKEKRKKKSSCERKIRGRRET
jgi:hypothetical protein